MRRSPRSSTGRLIMAGLRQHQRDGAIFGELGARLIGQFAEGGAGCVEQGFPAQFGGPGAQGGFGHALLSVVVEGVRDGVRIEPGPAPSSSYRSWECREW